MLHWQLALTNAVRMAAAAGNIRLLQHFVSKANYGHFVYKQAIGAIHKIRDARRGGGCLIGSHAIVQQGGGGYHKRYHLTERRVGKNLSLSILLSQNTRVMYLRIMYFMMGCTASCHTLSQGSREG